VRAGCHASNNSFKPTPNLSFVETCRRASNTGSQSLRSARLNSDVRHQRKFFQNLWSFGMTTRHSKELVLARWTVDAARLRAFTQQMRTRYGKSPFAPIDLLNTCEKHSVFGIEVVCRDDAIFVGPWCLAFLYNEVSALHLEDTWVRVEMERGLYEIPLPLAPNGRSTAQSVIHLYTQIAEEETRRYIAERQAPTWSNRLLNVAEAHFIWVTLGLFFVILPLAVLIIVWLRGSPE